jgi:hypothetical protein
VPAETTVLTQPRTTPAISVLLGPVAVSATCFSNAYPGRSDMRFAGSPLISVEFLPVSSVRPGPTSYYVRGAGTGTRRNETKRNENETRRGGRRRGREAWGDGRRTGGRLGRASPAPAPAAHLTPAASGRPAAGPVLSRRQPRPQRGCIEQTESARAQHVRTCTRTSMRESGEWRMRQSGSPRRSVKRHILPPPLHPTSHARSTSSTPTRSRAASYARTTTTTAGASTISRGRPVRSPRNEGAREELGGFNLVLDIVVARPLRRERGGDEEGSEREGRKYESRECAGGRRRRGRPFACLPSSTVTNPPHTRTKE